VSHRVDLSRVRKDLDRLDATTRNRVLVALQDLEDNPRPPSAQRLHGIRDYWRIRVGNWRVIYTIEDQQLVVLVVKIGHRGDVYRRL
jgi:mRNA interferase RelE/StbE